MTGAFSQRRRQIRHSVCRARLLSRSEAEPGWVGTAQQRSGQAMGEGPPGMPSSGIQTALTISAKATSAKAAPNGVDLAKAASTGVGPTKAAPTGVGPAEAGPAGTSAASIGAD